MENNQPNKQLLGLQQASQKKRQNALAKTEAAITKLVQSKQKITVRAVAREANVSVSYIYKYPELAYKIQSLRDAQKYDSDLVKERVSDSTKDEINKDSKEAELKQEIARLKCYIDSIKGKQKSPSKLQQENINLQLENEKLRQELKFTQQALAEARDFILSQGSNDTQDRLVLEKTKRVVKNIT